MSEALTEARVREIMDGCEGVQVGPWEVIASTRGDWPSLYVRSRSDGVVAQIMQGMVEGRFRLNAAHIARLDPDTVRALCTLALSALGTAPAELAGWQYRWRRTSEDAWMPWYPCGEDGPHPDLVRDVEFETRQVFASPASATAAEIRVGALEEAAKIADAFGHEIANDGTVDPAVLIVANVGLTKTAKNIAAAIRALSKGSAK